MDLAASSDKGAQTRGKLGSIEAGTVAAGGGQAARACRWRLLVQGVAAVVSHRVAVVVDSNYQQLLPARDGSNTDGIFLPTHLLLQGHYYCTSGPPEHTVRAASPRAGLLNLRGPQIRLGIGVPLAAAIGWFGGTRETPVHVRRQEGCGGQGQWL